jgi:hypothetical protein
MACDAPTKIAWGDLKILDVSLGMMLNSLGFQWDFM